MNPPQSERIGYELGELIGKMNIDVSSENNTKKQNDETRLILSLL